MEENKVATLEINKVSNLKQDLKEAVENAKNKPTDEEIENAKIEFETTSNNFIVKSYDIGESKEALEFLNYIKHYIRNRLFWTKNGWMGVVKMMEEVEDSEKFINMNPTSPLKLGYQALEFLFYSLQNPGGVGFQTAKSFESENDLFVRIFEAVSKMVTEARAELKHIQFLQDKYAAMQQGFYLELEDSVEETAPEEEKELEPETNK